MALLVSEIRAEMKAYSLAFDAKALAGDALDRVVDHAAAIEKMAPAAKARRAQPKVDAAAREGKLSPAQSALVTDAVNAAPHAEERLVGVAQKASLGELRDECERTKARVIDLEEQHRRVHATRAVRTYKDAAGAAHLHLSTTPEALAEYMSVLRPISDKLFNAARKEGRREPAEAYLADAMVELARRANTGGGDRKPINPTKIIMRIDWDALVRGWPIDGEVCEIAGVGPVPVSLVRALIDSGDAFLVITKGKDVVNVAHLGRRATAFQYSALQWRSPTCSVEGCNATLGVQVDHRDDWAKTKITLLGLLDPLCKQHHKMKTLEGWGLVVGHGKRTFVGPDDPGIRDTRNRCSPTRRRQQRCNGVVKIFQKRRPSTRIYVHDLLRMRAFFSDLGWEDDPGAPQGEAWIGTPGGRFALARRADGAPAARVELALAVPDELAVEEIAAAVEPAGGITTEPPQATAYGGWGFTFNDPEGNNWEIGAPTTVTHVDARLGGRLGTGFEGPLVALVVTARR